MNKMIFYFFMFGCEHMCFPCYGSLCIAFVLAESE
nr:MAG TPA: hypothetical protein [Caudoviricetes sp.]